MAKHMARANYIAKLRGQTLDGRHALCRCYCEKPPGFFLIKYPRDKTPNRIQRRRRCKIEPRPGCYWAPRPKNFINRVYNCKYCPERCCTRPCCLHIKPKECCCKYDDPCEAACVDHPFGMKPSGRYPPQYWRGPMRRRACC